MEFNQEIKKINLPVNVDLLKSTRKREIREYLETQLGVNLSPFKDLKPVRKYDFSELEGDWKVLPSNSGAQKIEFLLDNNLLIALKYLLINKYGETKHFEENSSLLINAAIRLLLIEFGFLYLEDLKEEDNKKW